MYAYKHTCIHYTPAYACMYTDIHGYIRTERKTDKKTSSQTSMPVTHLSYSPFFNHALASTPFARMPNLSR